MTRARMAAIGAVVVMVLAVVLWWRSRDANTAEAATYSERLRVLEIERDSLRRVMQRRDTVYRADTVTLRRTQTRYERVVDSIRTTDTLTVREQVIVQAADTALRACRTVITTCEQRVADRDAVIANERKTRATGDSLAAILLRRANPRFQPYAEALVDPMDSRTVVARAGAELRLLGPLRLAAGLQYTTTQEHRLRPLVGLRVRF